MARDRQRAKQRKARRSQNPGPAPSEPHRSNVPGELDHASGGVEGFEAALVAGAGGRPADEPEDETPAPAGPDDDVDVEDEDAEVSEAELARAAGAAAPAERPAPAAGPVPTRRGLGRFAAFLRASWAELQRVQWPDRRQVGQATAVVLGFVVAAGAYLGVADWVAQLIVDLVI